MPQGTFLVNDIEWAYHIVVILFFYPEVQRASQILSNSYTMGCPPVRGDNPRALASGLSYVQVDKHGMTNDTYMV